MAEQKKNYMGLVVVLVIVGGVLFLNFWLLHQVGHVKQDDSAVRVVETVPAKQVFPVKEERPPVIDPENDPLAPVVFRVPVLKIEREGEHGRQEMPVSEPVLTQ